MQTVRFKNELERNITIKLGYANAKIYKCEDDKCPRPMCFKSVLSCNIYLFIYNSSSIRLCVVDAQQSLRGSP